MTAHLNKKKIAEWDALKDRMNKAQRQRDFEQIVEISREAIKLDETARYLKIMTFLFYKDMAEAYLKMKDDKNALENFRLARDGLLNHRATQKLKFGDDWLHELKVIEKAIAKIEERYFD